MSTFLRTLAGESTKTAPIWIMRQAGRYLPEYRALRERYGFWEMVNTPELAAEATLQPVRRFGVDAAILFQDIMSPLPAMGIEVTFDPGPVIAEPLRDVSAVERLVVPPAEELAPSAMTALRMVAAESPVPVIGFAGAPLTLSAYLVEGKGSKEFATFRGLARSNPAVLDSLLDKLTDMTIEYLRGQVAAGAAAVQLFDTWAGLFDDVTYRRLGLPRVKRIASALEPTGAPLIYMAVGGGHLLTSISEVRCAAVSVDWRTPLEVARRRLPGKAIQGNLDPAALLGSAENLVAEADRVLRSGLGGPHVFNLGHGVMPQTDPDNFAALVDLVHAFDRSLAGTAAAGSSR